MRKWNRKRPYTVRRGRPAKPIHFADWGEVKALMTPCGLRLLMSRERTNTASQVTCKRCIATDRWRAAATREVVR